MCNLIYFAAPLPKLRVTCTDPGYVSNPQERTCIREFLVDQCAAGLRDSHGTLIRKPTHTLRNHPAILTGARCNGRREYARARNEELNAAQQYARASVNHSSLMLSASRRSSWNHLSTQLKKRRRTPAFAVNVANFIFDAEDMPLGPSGAISRPPPGDQGRPA
eukprot:208328-Pyramimonas_sp.AAC.1